jgi:hypothetical protein
MPGPPTVDHVNFSADEPEAISDYQPTSCNEVDSDSDVPGEIEDDSEPELMVVKSLSAEVSTMIIINNDCNFKLVPLRNQLLSQGQSSNNSTLR